jgi:23S rRNA (cytosine1962-C5)-methyltransferase
MSPRAVVELPRFLEAALSAGHPWVYRDHVPREFRARSGTVVEVRAGKFRGFALWDETSQIALRVYSSREPPSERWVRERVRSAWELRALVRETRTTAYRVIFGEGDGLPGITVDLYGEYAVIATYAEGLDAIVGFVVAALGELCSLKGVVRRNPDAESRLELVSGRMPPAELVVEEHGVRLAVDLLHGQKTGLFLDHRENRRFVAGLARDRRVLNLFSYTGAFSVHAALSGARLVTSVDIAQGAMDTARESFRLNGLDPDLSEFVVADVFEFLEHAARRPERYDLVICDPPSFAKNKSQQKGALKAYTRLNAAGFRVTAGEGLYAAASCSSQVGPEAFRATLAESAARARRRFQIVHETGQPSDHPVQAQHPEGRYLKFLVGRVLEIP